MLRIAIQKSGRLFDDSVGLLRDAGISFSSSANRLRTEATNFPLEIIFLRDDDIPGYVEDGVVDVGIVGENVLLETRKDVRTVQRLGFGKCRLCLALPKNEPYDSIHDLQGKRVATTYVNILGDYLRDKGVLADLHEVSGSVEITPSLGLADAIFDIVSTGSTLLSNGLREVETVLESEALLIANHDMDAARQESLDRLLFRMRANRNAKEHRYVLLNAPNARLHEVIALMPGMKSPTVVPLAIEGWSSVHSVLPESAFWEVLEKLEAVGAEGILVLPLERMIL
jgi:ATP phosphoribosyltransferase